jgi:hypothetical protein
MIRILVPTDGSSPAQVIEAIDTPEDRGLDVLAQLIIDSVVIGNNGATDKAAV